MKLNFETKILIGDGNISNLENIESFLRGMLKSSPDVVIEKFRDDLSSNIYYIKQLKKHIEDYKIELQ